MSRRSESCGHNEPKEFKALCPKPVAGFKYINVSPTKAPNGASASIASRSFALKVFLLFVGKVQTGQYEQGKLGLIARALMHCFRQDNTCHRFVYVGGLMTKLLGDLAGRSDALISCATWNAETRIIRILGGDHQPCFLACIEPNQYQLVALNYSSPTFDFRNQHTQLIFALGGSH